MKKLDYEAPVLQCITVAAGGGYLNNVSAPGAKITSVDEEEWGTY